MGSERWRLVAALGALAFVPIGTEISAAAQLIATLAVLIGMLALARPADPPGRVGRKSAISEH